MTRNLGNRWLLLAALIASTSAHALQLVEARDGVAVEAVISTKEPTRIRLEVGLITEVVGNLYSTSCGQPGGAAGTPGMSNTAPAVNPAGELVLECDKDKGEVFVRPVGMAAKPGSKPINLFVASDRATYTLLLKKQDVPADTIVIRDKSPRLGLESVNGRGIPDSLTGRTPAHLREIKRMAIAMASDRVGPDIRVEEMARPVKLWQEANFTLMRQYEGRGYVGEKYLLTNVSDAPMVLSEQEFDRDGDDVAAVAVETHNLRPGESTNVHVIRREQH